MRLLSSGANDPVNGLVHEEHPVFPSISSPQPYVLHNGSGEQETPQTFNIVGLLRKYWLLLLFMLILGSAAGFASIVLSAPMYKTLLLMEVTNTANVLPQNGGVLQQASSETSEVDIQTQVNLLHSEGFLRKGAERMQAETVPLAPTGRDIFSRLRQRIHPVTQDPLETQRTGLAAALKTFEARPVNHTRLIELTCESTSPDVAAGFLNAMAQEFVEDNSHSRITTALKTSEWLAAQIEEPKSRGCRTPKRSCASSTRPQATYSPGKTQRSKILSWLS